MQLELETKRLILRVLTPDYAEIILDFYMRNAAVFEKYEPIDSSYFYTLEYHKRLLTAEYKEMLQSHLVRYWIFEKENQKTPVGTLSFHNIHAEAFHSASLGYKIDPMYWRRGYCYEALSLCIASITNELDLHRIEALVLPDNLPSIGLLEKLGFEQEGLLKDKAYLQGKWRDHYLYSYIAT